jgi:hypothetical protein
VGLSQCEPAPVVGLLFTFSVGFDDKTRFQVESVDWFSVRQVRENPGLANPDSWFLVGAALSDDSLKDRLRRYYWLSINADNTQSGSS